MEVAKPYDHSRKTGANLARPALQELLADVEAGVVEIVVVYKLDRITRTLLDFARLVDLFERYGVALVSITQNFDTSDCMGRLIRNILLTFAQFEREIASDRMRDKMVRKQRGLWTGGDAPIGYDLKRGRLVVNRAKALAVRCIFATYDETKRVYATHKRLIVDGHRQVMEDEIRGEERREVAKPGDPTATCGVSIDATEMDVSSLSPSDCRLGGLIDSAVKRPTMLAEYVRVACVSGGNFMKLGASLILVAQVALSTTAAAQQDPPRIEVDWAALKEESEAREALADARKAEAEAETAATKARFGTLADVATAGTTTVGDKAGQLEAAILSNAATRKVASRIVSDVCVRAPTLCAAPAAVPAVAAPAPAPPTPPASACTGLDAAEGLVRLYVVTEAERPSFDTAEVVQASLCGLERRLHRAIASSDRLRNGGAVAAMGPAAVFTVANIVGNLFRSDYAVQGVALTADDLLLAKAVVAASAPSVRVPVALPSVYRPAALTSDNPLVRALAGLDELRTQAVQLGISHRTTAAALSGKGKAFAAKAAEQTQVAVELDAAAKALDDYVAKVATPPDKGVSELAEAARQARMRADLQAGSYMLALKMNAAGGSTVSRKNFWTFLGGVPFKVSGGTVASFTLIEGPTGNAVGGGSYGVAGGFQSIGAIHRRGNVQ